MQPSRICNECEIVSEPDPGSETTRERPGNEEYEAIYRLYVASFPGLLFSTAFGVEGPGTRLDSTLLLGVTLQSSLVPRPLSEKSRRGLATLPYIGLSRAVCTVRANQIAEFSYVTLIAS